MSGEISTRKLGLAAYIKMEGGQLQGYEAGHFVFVLADDDNRTINDWEMEYLNSCCHRHDTELVHLRKLMK